MDSKKVGIGIGIAAVVILLFSVILIIISKNETTYNVTFKNGGFTEVVEVKENDTVTRPTDPTKDGYTFEGWYYEDTRFDFTTKITKDIVLEARWTSASAKKWVVTFDSNGGNSIDSLNVEDGKTIIDIPTPKKEGYTFVAWYYNNKKFDFSTAITKDITLKAEWKKVEKPVSGNNETVTTKYTVTFETDGGSAVKSQSVEKNKTAVKPENPTKEGYTFVMWTLDGKTEFNFATTNITKDITLEAVWATYSIEKTNSDVGQVIIYVYKNDTKVDGYVDIKLINGNTVTNVEISKDGYVTNGYRIKSISNVRVK